jgi:hypothetical protein
VDFNKISMKRIIFLFVLSTLSGCANVQVTMYNKNVHYQPTGQKTIQIFQKKPEDRKFIEIGEITVDGASSMEQVEQIFRAKAAEYGGNAVYVYSTTQQTRTYIDPPRAAYYHEGFSYPHGHYFSRQHYYPYPRHRFRHYYYCYGCDYYNVETVTYLTVVGIVIRFTQP